MPSSRPHTSLVNAHDLHGDDPGTDRQTGLSRQTAGAVTSHRLGGRTEFLPRTGGDPVSWPHFVEFVGRELERPATVAEMTRISVRRWVLGRSSPEVQNLPLAEASRVMPDELTEVRRPVSYRGMRNYIGRIPLPSQEHLAHAGWFESRNEQENYRELVIRRPVTQMVTQPMRMEWLLAAGVRTHVPDALYVDATGQMTLVDVTRLSRLQDPSARAVFTATGLTAQELGWRYELRVELAPQHRRNVAFVYSHRHANPEEAAEWVRRGRELPDTVQLAQAATRLGNHRGEDYQALFHLIATRQLFVDLQSPLVSDSTVRRHPIPERSTPWLVVL